MSTTFSERIIVTPFFQASQKELEELERALQGLEQAMNGKWFPAPNGDVSHKTRSALRRHDTLKLLLQGTTLYRSQKKVQKRVGGEVVW